MKCIVLLVFTIILLSIPLSAATFDPDSENIHYFGRWVQTDQKNPKTTYGNAIHVNFQGTEIGITLSHSAQIYYQYRIDGGDFTVLSLEGSQIYTQLSSNLQPGEHTLEFIRRYEASYGITTFHGLTTDGDILPATPRPPIRIECIGNSITSGFGSEGPHSAETDNNYEAYGPRLARKINAEYSIISRSGISVSEYTDGDLRILDRFKGAMYTWSNADGIWDFSTWTPHIVTIMIGTNDYVFGSPSTQQYTDAYKELVEFVRSKYPEAEIYLIGLLAPTIWTGKWDPVNPAIESLAESFNNAGDTQVHYISTGTIDKKLLHETNDYSGDMTHPNQTGHEKIAERLFEVIGPVAEQIKADAGVVSPQSSSSTQSLSSSSSLISDSIESSDTNTESSDSNESSSKNTDSSDEHTESSVRETAESSSDSVESSNEESSTQSSNANEETASILLANPITTGIYIPHSVSHITFYSVLGQLIETRDVRHFQGSLYQMPHTTQQHSSNRIVYIQFKNIE